MPDTHDRVRIPVLCTYLKQSVCTYASEGWVTRFKVQHGFSNKRTHGQALGAAPEGIDQFQDKVRRLIESERLSLNQVYKAHEMICTWVNSY